MIDRREQCISLGCAMAAYGELEFEMFGFLCQSSAVVVSHTWSKILARELLYRVYEKGELIERCVLGDSSSRVDWS